MLWFFFTLFVSILMLNLRTALAKPSPMRPASIY